MKFIQDPELQNFIGDEFKFPCIKTLNADIVAEALHIQKTTYEEAAGKFCSLVTDGGTIGSSHFYVNGAILDVTYISSSITRDLSTYLYGMMLKYSASENIKSSKTKVFFSNLWYKQKWYNQIIRQHHNAHFADEVPHVQWDHLIIVSDADRWLTVSLSCWIVKSNDL